MRLLCEGDDGSMDLRILAEILRHLPVQVQASHSRGVLERHADGQQTAALRDGDFPEELSRWRPEPRPRRWESGGVWRGWMWRRKEIENYILDPEVMCRSFGWWPGSEKALGYERLLDEVMEDTAERTAARLALLGLLPRYERRVVKPIDPSLSGEALVRDLRERHRRAEGRIRISEDALVERFLALRPLCLRGGPGFHLWVMSGKDLLGGLARLRGVRERFPELIASEAVVEAVVGALRLDPCPWEWLPEWSALREEVGAWVTG